MIIYILCIIIFILLILLLRKQNLDKEAKEQLQNDIDSSLETINQLQNKISEVQNQYHTELNKKSTDLNTYFDNQKALRQSELDTHFDLIAKEKQDNLDLQYRQLINEFNKKENEAKDKTEKIIIEIEKNRQAIIDETKWQQEKFEALLAPIKQYEMEQQQRLFYTVQLSEQEKEDINYLINDASNKIYNKDAINKIIWSEYIKPNLDQTLKRIGIEEKPGIYKLTNINNGKSYIGKSTNVKKRISDHYKGVAGISTISKQTVHDEMRASGIWNWTIEIIIYSDKDKLNELEKYYINFFKSNEWGFNKTKGGEG